MNSGIKASLLDEGSPWVQAAIIACHETFTTEERL